jgi:hypothetical protein
VVGYSSNDVTSVAFLLVFHSFIADICYAVTFLQCGVGLSESKLMFWDPGLRVQAFINFLVQDFPVLLKLSEVG